MNRIVMTLEILQKLSTNDQDDLVCDLLTLLGGSFTTNASSDLENALEVSKSINIDMLIEVF